ncbi:MAG: glycosyltransferase family 39 protein [Acidisphaera sp.]|nr:glycosyltransferase family 39 protein [Acidisphaera sp.]
MTRLREAALRRPRLALVLYCLLVWLPGWASLPPTDRDESRFAQATKQMLESGDFVDIRNGTEARNRKPIGIYWLQAPGVALAQATGIARENPIWPYRVPSLAGGLVAVLATFAIGRRIAGTAAGLLAGAMLGGCVLLILEVRIAKTDAALLGATTIAMGVLAQAYLRRPVGGGRAALFWLAIGVGVLLKGPITPMVAGLTALTLALADRRVRWLAALRPAWGIPLLLAVVLPWFVAIGVATHGGFFRDALGGDLGNKLAGGDDAHGAPPGYHLLLLSATLFPGGFVALTALPSAWRGRREPATRFLLAWLVPSWLVFEAVPTKLPHYPLPLFPALCLLGAAWIATPARDPGPAWLRRGARGLTLAAAVVFTLAGAALPFVLAGIAPGDWRALAPLLAGGLLLWLLLRVRGTGRTLAGALLATPLLVWSVLALELPQARAVWVARGVCDAAAGVPHPGGFGAVGYAEPSLMFLCGTQTQLFSGPLPGAAFLAGGPGRLVAVEGREVAAFLAAAARDGITPQAVATVRGVNYSNGRWMTLSLYDRRDDN